MKITDEQRLAWARVNLILDTVGDGPEYRAAWNEWVALSSHWSDGK